MVFLPVDPPQIDWVYQTPSIVAQYGKNPVTVYINKLLQITEWSSTDLRPSQVVMISKIMNECTESLKYSSTMYTLVGKLLYPKFYDIDLWLRFFEPISQRHLHDMWYITPYIPTMPQPTMSGLQITNMLNNVAHLFRN